MKKRKFLLTRLNALMAAYFLFLLPVSGQEGGASGTLMLGAKTGVTSSRFFGAYVNDGALKLGYHVGLFTQYAVGGGLAVNLDINYSLLGAANVQADLFFALENRVNTVPFVSSDISVHALNVPLYVSYTIPGIDGSVSPYISFGCDFNFNLASYSVNTSAYLSDGNIYKFTTKTDLGGKVKLFDPGILAGTGFIFYGSPFTYVFDVRYKIGLANINNSFSNYADNSLYTRAINISLGVAYNF